jgi:hypothetical protein
MGRPLTKIEVVPAIVILLYTTLAHLRVAPIAYMHYHHMGLEYSREVSLPATIDQPETRAELISRWTPDIIRANPNNNHQLDDVSTLSDSVLTLAAHAMCDGLKVIRPTGWNILEVGAGNCRASRILMSHMASLVDQWICTDIIAWVPSPVTVSDLVFDPVHAVDAVAKYGRACDVLLMVCPSPPRSKSRSGHALEGFSDYYSVVDFIAQSYSTAKQNDALQPRPTPHSTPRIIIFIGELGVADGSPGMYKFMLAHPQLVLRRREIILSGMIGPYDKIEREVFIFEIRAE